MGFFKKLKKSVKKRAKKISKGAVKVAKTASGLKYAKKFYDKNKKGIGEWGMLAARGGAAFMSAGASEGVLASTGMSGLGLDSLLGPQGAETASTVYDTFKEGYDSENYVMERTKPVASSMPSRKISSSRSLIPFGNSSQTSMNIGGVAMNKTSLVIAGGAGLLALILLISKRGK